MPQTLGERIALVRARLRTSDGNRVSQAELGDIIARSVGRQKPLTKMAVSRWESGEVNPDVEVLAALAGLTKVDPGWLAFGESSQAPAPSLGVVTLPSAEEVAKLRVLAQYLMASNRQQKK